MKIKSKVVFLAQISLLSASLGMLSHAQRPSINSEKALLTSPNWMVRRDAFESLLADFQGPDKSRFNKTFVQLRERENVEANKGTPDLFEDDDYLAYDDRLADIVEKIAVETNDPEAWRSLVNMRYNPDSRYGVWLSKQCVALPYVAALLDSPFDPRRMNGVYVTAAMLKNCSGMDQVARRDYRRLTSRIRWYVGHGSIPVSVSAIQGLGILSDKEDGPFLMTFSNSISDTFRKNLALKTAQQIEQANRVKDAGSALP